MKFLWIFSALAWLLTSSIPAGEAADPISAESTSSTLLANICRPWWKEISSCSNKEKPRLGIDLQSLGVFNQSPGADRPYFSSDNSIVVLGRDVNLLCRSLGGEKAELTIVHEPGLGVTGSIHFHDPGDEKSSKGQSDDVTLHPLVNAQSDLLNLTINKVEARTSNDDKGHVNEPEPLFELKISCAPQVDLYGTYNHGSAQFQLPIQPGFELHFCPRVSLVGQLSVPLFTVGGRNPPASLGIGLLLHAFHP
jgi:hypothetical protein